MKATAIVALAITALVSGGAWAQTPALTDGEIRKVDRDAQKLTIRHGRLEKFDMPAMTMVFQVKDGASLDQLKVGDKIAFGHLAKDYKDEYLKFEEYTEDDVRYLKMSWQDVCFVEEA